LVHPLSRVEKERKGHPVKKKAVAFYFMTHGPLREPRLIELQYMRVLRYRNVGPHYPDENPFLEPEIFIDLTRDRRDPEDRLEKRLPQLYRLLVSIVEGRIGKVYVDIMEDQSPTVGYSWVIDYLQKAGAHVINIFYDEDRLFDNALKKLHGPDARWDEVNDASDFVCFFPALATEVAYQALGERWIVDSDPKELNMRLYNLRDSNPYSRGRTPFIEERLGKRWLEERERGKTRENAARRKSNRSARRGAPQR
jgi:hypothetical protein